MKQRATYVRLVEEGRFIGDIHDRVETLAFAWVRMRELAALYRKTEAAIDEYRPASEEGGQSFEYPDTLGANQRRCQLEARTLMAFVYYEVTSLVSMLKASDWGIELGDGELAFLVQARNKLLAHPTFRGPIRNSSGALEISKDGLLKTWAINLQETNPKLIKHYTGSSVLGSLEDWAQERRKNKKLIMSQKRIERFTDQEKKNLKAFGVGEPDVVVALAELAGILNGDALSKVRQITNQSLPVAE